MSSLPFLAHGPIAQAFAEQTRDYAFLYDRGQSAAWRGSRWVMGDKHDLLLKGSVNTFLNELYPQYPSASGRKVLLDSRFRQGVVEQVKPLLPAWKFSERFDQDPYLLGVPGNAVVNLRTGQVREMTREDFVTKRTRVSPDPNCEPKLFLKFMDEITDGDKELNGYLMRHAGYGLTGCTNEHCLPFWWGHGGNGKGVLLNVRQHILGYEYGTVLRMSDLARRETGNDNQRRIIAKLCGTRLVTANEGNAKVKLDMALLKSLASSDLLSGANLYENEFTFVPTHKLVVATNNKPELEIDAAARRRVHLVPFTVSFKGRENRELEEQLKKEAGGILHVMIQACIEWQRSGLAAPKSVTEATEELFRQLDTLGRFMSERLKTDPSGVAFVSTADLVRAYSSFLMVNGEETYVDQRKFKTDLKERGGYTDHVQRIAGHQQRGLRGVSLCEDPE